MKLKDIQKGDKVTYRNGGVNYVNKPIKYQYHYTKEFRHKAFDSNMDIIKIERYIKVLGFYKLKTIYKR